jgi:hypothetical protein
LLLGKLVAGPASHEQLVALLQVARILAIPVVVYATYKFLSRFLPDEWWRKWATLLAVAGGGLGWLVLASGHASWLGSQPLELYSPETFGFLAAMTFPHLLLSRAFLLLALDAYLEASIRPRMAWAALAWLVGLVVLEPLSIAAAVAAIGAHQVLLFLRSASRRERVRLWDSARPAVIALAVPALLIGGYALLLQRDTYMQAWAMQNVLTSPHIAHYLLAYGLLLPPAILGAWRASRAGPSEQLLLVGWALALPVLAYAPVEFQRRLPEGGWVAVCALAALGLIGLRTQPLTARRFGLGLLSLGLVSTVLMLIATTRVALRGLPPVFRDADQVAGFEWLAENADPGSVVLTSYETGNALPAWAPVFVLIGHGPESAGLSQLEPRVRAYYASSGSDPEGEALLREFGVSYVFVGEAERAWGFTEASAPLTLSEACRRGDIVIYEVKAAPLADRGWYGRMARFGRSPRASLRSEALIFE